MNRNIAVGESGRSRVTTQCGFLINHRAHRRAAGLSPAHAGRSSRHLRMPLLERSLLGVGRRSTQLGPSAPASRDQNGLQEWAGKRDF